DVVIATRTDVVTAARTDVVIATRTDVRVIATRTDVRGDRHQVRSATSLRSRRGCHQVRRRTWWRSSRRTEKKSAPFNRAPPGPCRAADYTAASSSGVVGRPAIGAGPVRLLTCAAHVSRTARFSGRYL